MLIRSVSLENIGPFRGRDVARFDLNGQFCAVVGLNGSGKSTLFRAAALCLFGAGDRSATSGREAYEARVRSLVRPLDGQSVNPKGAVSVDIEIEREDGQHLLQVTRRWRIGRDEELGETLEVVVDGEPVPLKGRDLDLWLGNWIPPQRAGVIFFDAEAVYSATEQDLAIIVAAAFRQAFGLDLVATLVSDLTGLAKTVAKKATGAEHARSTLAALDQEVEGLNGELERLVQTEAGLKAQRASLHSRAVEIRFTVGAYDGAESEYSRVNRRMAELDAARTRLRTELDVLCAGPAPAVLCSELCARVVERLESEEQSAIAFDSARGQRAAALAAIDEIRAAADWPGLDGTNAAREEFLNYLSGLFLGGIGEPIEPAVVHDVNRADRELLRGWLSELRAGGQERSADALQARIVDVDLERAELASRLQRVLEPEASDALTGELAAVEVKADQLEHDLLELAERRGALGAQIAIASKRADDALRSAVADMGSSTKADILLRSRDAALELSRAVSHMRALQVGAAAQTRLTEWLRKDDLVNTVLIDGDSLDVVLRNAHGDLVSLGQLSAGERQIVVLAILMGLRDAANVRQPLLVDTPLARLDTLHAHRVTRALADSDSQCVLFMTDEEWAMLCRVAPELEPTVKRLSMDSALERKKVS
jgi:DNA sulfur modification protein DndD